jgi:hypothetical protein
MTMYATPSSSPVSYVATIAGWLSLAAATAS